MTSVVLLMLASIGGLQDPKTVPTAADEPTAQLAAALRDYFAAANARGPELAAVRRLAAGREAEREEMLRKKTFLAPGGAVARRGSIDATFRFVDDPAAKNPFLVSGPANPTQLCPLIVYVPDAVDSQPFARELQRDGADAGCFVLLVPDEKRDNRYQPGGSEIERHVGPLRDLLLQYPIDPDRVYFVGSGRGGHATWDIGLMRSERWAGIFPCNGGLIHEGGFVSTGGVFVENGKDLTIFTVYNTTFDHGIDSCRNAARWLRQWGCKFEATEEQTMRTMGLAEAMAKLAPVVRQPHKRTITKRFNRLADGSHYWLTALDRRPKEWDPAARIVVRGEWPTDRAQQQQAIWNQVQQECGRLEGMVAGNTMRIAAQGIGRLRVWFDPRLVDFDAKVTITVNGQARAPLQPSRKLDVMLQRVHETGDTARLYLDFVDLTVPR